MYIFISTIYTVLCEKYCRWRAKLNYTVSKWLVISFEKIIMLGTGYILSRELIVE
jgi:hypothetical protein